MRHFVTTLLYMPHCFELTWIIVPILLMNIHNASIHYEMSQYLFKPHDAIMTLCAATIMATSATALPRIMVTTYSFNSLWSSDAIWRQGSGSTLAQVMACCLTAPSHYLNQCWLITSKVQWHSSGGNFTRDTSASNYQNKIEKYLIVILFKSSKGQWVKWHVIPKCDNSI